MSTDKVADLLTIVRNGYMAKKDKVKATHSRFREQILSVLEKEGYIKSYQKSDHTLEITLSYKGKEPVLTHITRVSKPGRRIYAKKKALPKILGGIGLAIVSTPQGLMTNKEARIKGLGGEIICEVW